VQQNLRARKNFGGTLPPNAPRGYGPGMDWIMVLPKAVFRKSCCK